MLSDRASMTNAFSILLSRLLVCCLFAWSIPASAQARPALLVLGDSLSAGYGLPAGSGWVDLLRHRLHQQGLDWAVINASITGDTTRGGLSRLPEALARHRPQVVIIELGGNDGLRGFPLAQIRANLRKLVQLSRDAGAKVILLGVRLPPNYGEYAERFHALYHQVAETEQVPLVAFFMQGVAENRDLMQADGIHPAVSAQPRLLDNVWPTLQPLLNDNAKERD